MAETIVIKARLLLNAKGKWAIYGWNDAAQDDVESVLYDMMGDEDIDTCRSFNIIASIPLPESSTIVAKVEASE